MPAAHITLKAATARVVLPLIQDTCRLGYQQGLQDETLINNFYEHISNKGNYKFESTFHDECSSIYVVFSIYVIL